MKIISEEALFLLKGNNRAMGKLMILFNRCQNSIENWMTNKDQRLITPDAVDIICEETGLQIPEIVINSEDKKRL